MFFCETVVCNIAEVDNNITNMINLITYIDFKKNK